MDELNKISAKQLVEYINQKKISAVEVAQAYLAQIEKVNPTLNAIIQKANPEHILQQAKYADETLMKGKSIGKLHGLPITIKDTCNVKGFICAKGSKGYANHIPLTDATVIARLRKEGAIILGITNVPEFMFAFETENDLYGRTYNPYDLTRTPGGSSGGEAAIIAAGGSPFGLGSDGGGSIRLPAHNTGIVGLKPTKGLIPLTGTIPVDGVGLIGSIVTYGPMARYIEDLIYTLPIIAGPDGYDPNVYPIPLQNPEEVILKSLRVAYYTITPITEPTAETIQTIIKVVKKLEHEVALIEENCPPDLEKAYQLVIQLFFFGSDKGQTLKNLLKMLSINKPSKLLQEFLQNASAVELDTTTFRSKFIEIDRVRLNMQKFLADYDVIICPVAATPAKPHGVSHKEWRDFNYTMPYNLTGWPAATVRCGTTSDGLPIGVQVIAKPWHDYVALAVAKKLEQLFGGWQEPILC